MAENYGAVEDSSADGVSKTGRFSSLAEYEASSLTKVEIRNGSLDASAEVMPKDLQAVGVTVEAWGKFVGDINHAISTDSMQKFSAIFVGIFGICLAFYLVLTLPGESKGCETHSSGGIEGEYCGLTPSRFTAKDWGMILLNILIFILAICLGTFAVFGASIQTQFDTSLREMCRVCDATICAFFSGRDGYPSSDINESHMETRTKERSREARDGDPIGPNGDTVTQTYQVRVYKQIPGHIVFTSVKKGRLANKLV